MPDNPNVVALLKEFKNESSITRTEVARIVGRKRGYVAGICHRNGIAPWPRLLPHVFQNRGCQFPLGIPGTETFRLCGMFREGDPLLCNEHKKAVWKPQAQVLRLEK